MKSELQEILSTKQNLYGPLIIEQVKKLISLLKPFSDTLNIKDLSKGKWATIKEIYIKPQKSEESKIILSQVLSHLVNENILTVGKIIANFFQVNKHNIISPFISFDKLDLRQPLDSDTFSENYSLIQPYLPKKILNKSPIQKIEETFFSALKEIEELKEAYIKYSNDQLKNPDNHLKIVVSFLEIIRKFYKSEDIHTKTHFQGILGNYVYFLEEQCKALSFCKKLYPQSQDLQPLTDVITVAKKILIEGNLLDKVILDIKLKPYEATDYYEEALKWLEKFTEKQPELIAVINEIKANAHYYLGMIYENSESQLDWFKAIKEYINALEMDKDFNFNYGHDNHPHTFSKICKKIGGLFLNLGRFWGDENKNEIVIKLLFEAIKYFKVSLSIEPIEECSFILRGIFNTPKNKKEVENYLSLKKDLYISLAGYLFKSNLISQAILEYDLAASSTDDDKEEQELLLSKLKASETKMGENTAFQRSILEKGKKEDLSSLAREDDRTRFFNDTHTIIDGFVPPPKQQAEQPKNVEQNQNEQLPNDKKEINKQTDTEPQKQLLVQPQQPQPQSMENTPLHTIENIQKPDYWYTEDNIKNILEANIDQDKFSIVTHVDLAHPEQVRDALREGVYEDLKKKGKVVLMPINTGHGHWVSMMISKDDTNKIIFTYNDPLGTLLNDRPNLVKLITEICPDAEIIDLKIQQQEEGNTSDCGVFVCDDLIRQSEGLAILTTEQSRGQGLNLRKSQAETLKHNLINQQPQEQHVYINIDSNTSDDEDEDNNNGNNKKIDRPPYGDNNEVNELGVVPQPNDQDHD